MSELAADVGELLWVGFLGTEVPNDLRTEISLGQVGAVVLFRRNLLQGDCGTELAAVRALTADLHGAARAGSRLLIAVDEEGGRVQRVRAPATTWPAMACAAAHLPAMMTEVGRAYGRELAALGFDIDFAPVLDVNSNPANPIIGDRAFGSVPGPAADRALAFAEGLAAAGILSCGKHFPGHGDTSTDSHLELPRIDHDLERLRAVELAPFARAGALPMIMTAHVVFSAVDPKLPATLCQRVLQGILRQELGYRGLVVSDDLDMQAIRDHFGAAEAAVAAVEAGCDALLMCADHEAQVAAREALIREAEQSPAFRACVARGAAAVRQLKTKPEPERPPLAVVGCEAHLALATTLAG